MSNRIQHNTPTRRGFSLIELMIIVALLGILAAVVIPKFSNATDTAKAGSLATQITTVKKAMQRYKIDHNDNYPTEDQLVTNPWQVLTSSTDIDGDTAGTEYGPYLMKPPMNSYKDSNAIAADNSAAWQYDETTGIIQAVVPQSVFDQATQLQLDSDDLVVEP